MSEQDELEAYNDERRAESDYYEEKEHCESKGHPMTDLIAAARELLECMKGPYFMLPQHEIGSRITRAQNALAALPSDAVICSRALLIEAAEYCEISSADPYENIGDPELAARLRAAAGER